MKMIRRRLVAVGCCIALLFCTLIQGNVTKAQSQNSGVPGVPTCQITDWNTVEFKVSLTQIPQSDDQLFYLIEMNTFEYELQTQSQVITTGQVELNVDYTFALNHGKENTRLYKKFVLAIKQNGVMKMITEPQYITNPEYLANNTRKRAKTTSKKGLLLDDADPKDLGVQHFITNMYVDSGECMTNILDQKGIKNVVVLNRKTSNQAWLNPLSRDSHKANYYMFNAADEAGVKLLTDSFKIYAHAYDYDNWIIGNEINARNPWNYTKYVPVEQYTREYVQAFRVMYTAIKSVNANAQVFISLDQSWNRNQAKDKDYYDARDVLDCFNSMILEGGNIDYGIAYHPYPVPLFWAKVWDMSSIDPYYATLIQDSPDSPMVSFQNLHVLTDYLKQSNYLNPKGKVRNVILSEIGLNSEQGEEVQAAALVYAYLAAEGNDLIDAIIFSRGNDKPEEMSDHMAFGLLHEDGTPKIAYEVFKYMDTSNANAYMSYAKSIIGIGDWSQLLNKTN